MKNLSIFSIVFLTVAFSCANAQYKQDSLKLAHGYLHYYVEGKGEPIVYLQGGPGYSGIDLKQVADSFPGHQNILIDYEGTGLSQYRKADTSWVTIDNIVANIEAVRSKLNIKKWVMLGHSYGTHFALYYAVKHPQYVARLILVAACGTSNEFQQYFGNNNVARLSDEDTIAINKIWDDTTLTAQRRSTMFDSIYLRAYFYNRSKLGLYLATIPEENLPTYYNEEFSNAYFKGPQFKRFNIGRQVQKLTIPILILQGRQDPIGEAVPILLQQKLKNCRLEFINKCGHFVWVEKPTEFYHFARTFLKE